MPYIARGGNYVSSGRGPAAREDETQKRKARPFGRAFCSGGLALSVVTPAWRWRRDRIP